MIRHLSLIVLSLALSGCDLLRSGLMDPAEKINAAFPLPQGLAHAQEQLLADPQLEPAEAEALRQEYEQLLQGRATACSHNASPGRLDTLADLRRTLTDSACFHEHDLALQEWVGLRRFMLAMRKPAPGPLEPLPVHATLPKTPEPAIEVIAAREANVVVLRGATGRLTTVELPSGKTLGSFAAPAPTGRPATLSPNGHVLAVPIPNALRMLDPETGDTLWTTSRFTEVTAWLPEVDATLLAPGNSQQPAVLDQRSGSIEPYPLALPALTWSVAVAADGKARQVMGNADSAYVIDHSRDDDGSIDAVLVTRRALPGKGLTGPPPLVMDNGRKLVFSSGNDLGWVDLDGNDSAGAWNLSPLRGRGFAKNSETTVYLDIGTPGRDGGPRLLDIDRATLSRVEAGAPQAGELVPLAGRDGWVRRDRAVTLGHGAAPDGPPEPIGQVIAGTGIEPASTP